MNLLSLPWAELCVLLPFIGVVVVGFVRDPAIAGRWTLGFNAVVFICSVMPWVALQSGLASGPFFAVDGLTAPLLPLVALLHLLTVLATARVKRNRMSFGGHLAGEGLWLGTFAAAPSAPWLLVLFLIFGTLPPLIELWKRGKPIRVYALHMAAFTVLLATGWAAVKADSTIVGAVLLSLAVLVRSGTAVVHLWVADLFQHASFGTALLYVAPLAGVYAALRLVIPIAPEWVLEGIGLASLITAVYAAGLAAVQYDARRFFAYLVLSHTSLVMVGLEIHTAISLTGALCLWASVAISLVGLGITLRAVEARHGRLTLTGYRGFYDESPSLAVGFLLMGLGSVGFPATFGFVAAELLVDGAITADPAVAVGIVAAAALNGIAVVRAYLALFTGVRHSSPLPFGITIRERIAVLTLAVIILGCGIYPQPFVAACHASAESILDRRATRIVERVDERSDVISGFSRP